MRVSHIPVRLAAGSFILNSGIGKLHADEITAKGLHSMAMGTYPFVDNAEPMVFARSLGAGEILIGATLLSPFVSPFMAGATLVGFSGALLHMYRETPGMTEDDGVRPTSKGVPLAKDVWMLGIGLGLMIDGVTPKRKRHKPGRTAATPRR
jgi:uncharacterized membrane protein YphA (DoxX/SURF4 family)